MGAGVGRPGVAVVVEVGREEGVQFGRSDSRSSGGEERSGGCLGGTAMVEERAVEVEPDRADHAAPDATTS